MPILSTNIRAFNSYAESPKLHNVVHSSSPEVPQASQKRQIQARLKKMEKEEQRCPSRSVCPTHRSASLDTRILTGKVQMLTGAGSGLGDSAASICLSLMAVWFSLLTTH